MYMQRSSSSESDHHYNLADLCPRCGLPGNWSLKFPLRLLLASLFLNIVFLPSFIYRVIRWLT